VREKYGGPVGERFGPTLAAEQGRGETLRRSRPPAQPGADIVLASALEPAQLASESIRRLNGLVGTRGPAQ
jgi:hypothetical protein